MKLVLDTNVVIDWLVFADPYMSPLRSAVNAGHIEVITHAPALEELRRVLGYPALKLPHVRQMEVLGQYGARTRLVSLPEHSTLSTAFPRCKDPDDNHFLALAFDAQADALVSRDKALLKLRRRVTKFGFQILDVQQMIAVLSGDRYASPLSSNSKPLRG